MFNLENMFVLQLFPVIDSTMVEPLRIARDRYEDMKEKNSMPPVFLFRVVCLGFLTFVIYRRADMDV
jgi:hypothetical protein